MQFKEYLSQVYAKLLVAKQAVKQDLLIKILKCKIQFLNIKNYFLNQLINLLTFIEQQKYYYKFTTLKLKKYLLHNYNKIFFIKDNTLKFSVQILNNIKYFLNKYLLVFKKNLLQFINLLCFFKEYFFKKFYFLILFIIKQTYLLKWIIISLWFILISTVFYISKELIFQNTIHNSIISMENELANTLLPVTNLLSKAKGNIDIAEYINEASIKPVLSYQVENDKHIIELVFLNPVYGLIDCSGEIISNITYPIKINLIWQSVGEQERRYDLICERYNNYNPQTKLIDHKDIYKTTLLRNINAVRFQFLEQLPSGNIKIINLTDLKKNQSKNDSNIKITAVQIGMIIQSSAIIHTKPQHSWYNLFSDRLHYFDNYNRKVIYITTNSNLT